MAEVADFARNCQTGAPLASMKPYSAYFGRPRVHCVITRRFEATAARSASLSRLCWIACIGAEAACLIARQAGVKCTLKMTGVTWYDVGQPELRA